MSNRNRINRSTRNGTTIVICLVALTVTSIILLGLARASLKQRLQTRMERQLEQTYWVLDAGLGLAIERFASDPEQEDFQINLDGELEKYQAKIDFVVKDAETETTVKVTARLQSRHKYGSVTQRSKTIRIPKLQQQTGQPKEESNENDQ